jgi:xylulokinase
MKTVLAYDLGGSALKAGLVDQTGQVVASVATALRFSEPCPFWSEADPLQWWLTMVSLTRELLSRPAAVDSKIVAVVVCGMTRTQVFVDAAGRPVRPAITWADGRATGEADRLSALSSGTDAENTVFGPVNAYHTLARVFLFCPIYKIISITCRKLWTNASG